MSRDTLYWNDVDAAYHAEREAEDEAHRQAIEQTRLDSMVIRAKRAAAKILQNARRLESPAPFDNQLTGSTLDPDIAETVDEMLDRIFGKTYADAEGNQTVRRFYRTREVVE